MQIEINPLWEDWANQNKAKPLPSNVRRMTLSDSYISKIDFTPHALKQYFFRVQYSYSRIFVECLASVFLIFHVFCDTFDRPKFIVFDETIESMFVVLHFKNNRPSPWLSRGWNTLFRFCFKKPLSNSIVSNPVNMENRFIWNPPVDHEFSVLCILITSKRQ